jgi:Ca-activated chloride channel family protein
LRGSDATTRRVLLLTDGQANAGVTDPADLVRMTRGAAEHGIATTTIGFGDGFDEDLLTAMADAGRGAAHYAASPDDAAEVFADEADDLAALAAQNITVAIRRTHPNLTGVEILGDWPVEPDGEALRIVMGDAYAGRTRRLVLALDVAGLPDLGPCHVADLTLEYTSLADQVEQHTLHLPVTVHVADAAAAEAAGIDVEVREEVAILVAARAQQQAIDAVDRGDIATAQMYLRSAADQLRGISDTSARPEEFLDRAAELDGFAGLARWTAAERKAAKFAQHRN